MAATPTPAASTTSASFRSELSEIPTAIRDTLQLYINKPTLLHRIDRRSSHVLAPAYTVAAAGSHRVTFIFTGMGSSYFSIISTVEWLQRRGIDAQARETSEWLASIQAAADSKEPSPSLRGWNNTGGGDVTIVVAVSQSGESGELCQLIEYWQKQHQDSNRGTRTISGATPGRTLSSSLATSSMPATPPSSERTVSSPSDAPTVLPLLWAITNEPASTLGRAAQEVFPTVAGHETTVACKTYVSGLLVQHLLARSINYYYGATPPTVGDEPVVDDDLQQRVLSLADRVETNIRGQWASLVQPLTNFLIPATNYTNGVLTSVPHIELIGSLTSLSTIHQSCLNVKEVVKATGEALSVGQFRHGPVEMVWPHFRAIIVAHDAATHKWALKLSESINSKWGGGRVLILTNQLSELEATAALSHALNVKPSDTIGTVIVPLPIDDASLVSMYDIGLIQLLFIHWAELRGMVAGAFRNVTKVTK